MEVVENLFDPTNFVPSPIELLAYFADFHDDHNLRTQQRFQLTFICTSYRLLNYGFTKSRKVTSLDANTLDVLSF